MKTVEEFETWKAKLPEQINFVQQTVFEPANIDIDHSMVSMEFVVSWLLNKYSFLKEIDNESGLKTLDAVGRYVGETFRKHFSGEWTIDLEDEEYAYQGYPGITDFESDGTVTKTVYPVFWVTTTIGRRTPFLVARFDYHFQHLGS
jgi:hypothetical protein